MSLVRRGEGAQKDRSEGAKRWVEGGERTQRSCLTQYFHRGKNILKTDGKRLSVSLGWFILYRGRCLYIDSST